LEPNRVGRSERWLALMYCAGYCREAWWPTAVGTDSVEIVQVKAGEPATHGTGEVKARAS
ncbi:MAG: hypothetical protein ACREUZ_20565, partial [Burkholderiales bacterium]